ncbi:hypothetical protein RMATCC62417_16553 [Rhizopus microsporus]|nr:hypothetical protein RMATCC62417_16553 [Rhizopus microsporus]
MTCPSQYVNTKINVDTGVQNCSFFTENCIDQWSFKQFLRAQGKLDFMSLKDIKSCKHEYVNSLFSLSKKSSLDADLLWYINSLINTKHSNEELITILNDIKAPKINIVNSTIQNSNIITAEGSSAVSVSAKNKGKRKLNSSEHEHTISVARNKKVFSFIKPTTPGVEYNINSPVLAQSEKTIVDLVVYVKISDNCRCDNNKVSQGYNNNMLQQRAFSYLNKTPAAKQFLGDALNQPLEKFLFWIGSNGFNITCSDEELKATLFVRLVLNDFYANCVKPVATTLSNERTPFVEYVVPLFKYFSAAYSTIAFQWCEKGLETNRYVSLYHTDTTGRKRLADGVGYTAAEQLEALLVESSGEDDGSHTSEDTLKLLECSIRALKLEMEKLKGASYKTFQQRRFLTCLYAGDKLTLMSTSLVDDNRWGFITVREAVIPRTWAGRYSWGKAFELLFCLRDLLKKQKQVSEQLSKEDDGWIEDGETIFEKMK